eukprot:c47244_g1_i1 orf=383-793(+)
MCRAFGGGMLLRCAQYQQCAKDTFKAMENLNKLKGQVSQHGEGRQRVVECTVGVLKACISSRVGAMADSVTTASASWMIKACMGDVSAYPYVKSAHYVRKQTIRDVVEGASRRHIVTTHQNPSASASSRSPFIGAE